MKITEERLLQLTFAAIVGGRIKAPRQAAVWTLKRIGEARALANLAVAHCNGELTPRQIARSANLQRKMLAEFKEIFGDCAKVSFGGDPRGYVVRVKGDEFPSNCCEEGIFGIA